MINYLLPLQLSQLVAPFIRSIILICKNIRDCWVLSGGTDLISGAGALRTLRMTGVFMLNIIFIIKLKDAIYYFTI